MRRQCTACRSVSSGGPAGSTVRGRGRIIRFRAVGAPVPLVRARFRVEHNHAMVLIRFRHRRRRLRSLEDPRASASRGRRSPCRCCRRFARSGRSAKRNFPARVKTRMWLSLLAVAADPDAILRVDGDAMHLLRPLVARSRASPRLDDIACRIELDNRRRRHTALPASTARPGE